MLSAWHSPLCKGEQSQQYVEHSTYVERTHGVTYVDARTYVIRWIGARIEIFLRDRNEDLTCGNLRNEWNGSSEKKARSRTLCARLWRALQVSFGWSLLSRLGWSRWTFLVCCFASMTDLAQPEIWLFARLWWWLQAGFWWRLLAMVGKWFPASSQVNYDLDLTGLISLLDVVRFWKDLLLGFAVGFSEGLDEDFSWAWMLILARLRVNEYICFIVIFFSWHPNIFILFFSIYGLFVSDAHMNFEVSCFFITSSSSCRSTLNCVPADSRLLGACLTWYLLVLVRV